MASDLGESLTYKIGPLPAWAWGVGLGVSVLAYTQIKSRLQPAKAPTPVEVDETAAGDLVVGSVAPDGWTGSPMGGGSWVPAPSGGVITGDPDLDADDDPAGGRPETNDQWRRLAADYLLGTGLFQPTLVNDALVKYLDGIPMNAAEVATVNAAIRALGAPPDGAPPILREQDPAPVSQAPVTQQPQAPQPQPVAAPAASRPNLYAGLTHPVVDELTFWLNTRAGQSIWPPAGTYHDSGDHGHEHAVNNLLRFLNNGTRDVAQFGDRGVNQAFYGLVDYLSSLNGYPSIPAR